MKNKPQALLMALMTFGAIHHAAAQGTAFTYQGRLNDSGQCANGQFDLQFELYGSATGGTPLYASTTATSDVLVTNGLFTVTLDFGPVFTGGTYYLETDVRTNSPGTALPYTTLAPRLQVLPVPYAVYAENAGIATSVGGQTAISIAQGVVAANNATPSSVPNSIVQRDTNGNFSANALTLSGALNLPFPAILSTSGTNFLMEDGSLYAGVHAKRFVIQRDDLLNTGFGDYALEYEATTPITISGSNGMYNTAVGQSALTDNETGWGNTAVGYDALENNQIGYANTAVGYEALMFTDNTNGLINTAVGFQALWANSSGGGNTANGAYALLENVTGSNNTSIGLAALEYNTNGYDNTASGFGALRINESGFYNTADGVAALSENLTGSYNTASGVNALFWNSTGSNNTVTGALAAFYNTNGSDITAVGLNALNYAINDSRAVAVGESALMYDNSYAYAGTNSGFSENTAVGYQALEQNNSGTGNTAEGYQTLLNNTNGSQNTAIGVSALLNNTSGAQNTANGAVALFNNINGAYNTATGFGALYANTSGYWNVADGYQSLYNNITGYSNTANGASALSANTTGAYNTGTGAGTLSANSTGSFNTAGGYNALLGNSSGSYNTAEGAFALLSSTGSNNIALGVSAGANLVTGSSNIYIGNPGVNGDNHAIRIGDVTDTNTTVTVIAGIFNGTLATAGTEVMVDSSGHLGVRVSSAKFKHDIQPMGDVSDVLLKLKPVTFKYNTDRDPSGTPEFGLVAEQVNEVDPDLVVRDGNHQIYSVRYEAVNAMLLNEFLKQHQTVEDQSATIADLKTRLDRMEQMMSKHE